MVFLLASLLYAAEVVYDYFTTRYLLSKGHTELNPVSAWGFKRIGLIPTFAVEFAAIVALGFLSPWVVVGTAVLEGLNDIRQFKLVRKA